MHKVHQGARCEVRALALARRPGRQAPQGSEPAANARNKRGCIAHSPIG